MKRERNPTPEEFEKLLAWLDADREEAGIKLNLIHTRLIRIFVSRGCIDAEYLADEVINRVTVRIDQVKTSYSDPLRCCVGFADKVYREWLRDQLKTAFAKEPPPPRPSDELEREDGCLSRCVEELIQAECYLFKRYFQGEKRARIDARRKLAAELDLTANALRIQAFRIRRKTRKCMEMCLDEA